MSEKKQRIQVGEHVSMVQRGRKNIWHAEFHWDGGHRRKSLRTPNKKKALREACKIEADIANNTYSSTAPAAPSPAPMPLSIAEAKELFLAYKEMQGRRRKTLVKYRSNLREFSDFCHRERILMLPAVSLLLFDGYRQRRRKVRSEKTVFNECVNIKAFLGWCAARDLIPKNPLANETFEKPVPRPRGGPNLDQVNAALSQFSGTRRAAIAMLAFAGMRAGEVQRLRLDADDVDLENNWIRIESRPGAETKSGDCWKVPIHPRLKAELEKLKRASGHWYFTQPPSRAYPSGDNHLNMKRLNEEFQRTLNGLGVPTGKKNGGFTLHSLRSFFKTFCIHSGIPREVVDTWQNHIGNRPRTASDLYYHLSDEESQRQMLRVPFGDA